MRQKRSAVEGGLERHYGFPMRLDSQQMLHDEISKKMPGADKTTVEIIAAVAGLLASIAYADRTITDAESAHLKTELRRINGIAEAGIEAISQVLHDHALRLSTAFVQRFTRVLRDELPEEQRAEILDALLGMAAADGEITLEETVSLRNITSALGLSQGHYNQLQEKYRDKLRLG
jgi:uncharacterized tellurite resistance protein B-like protein